MRTWSTCLAMALLLSSSVVLGPAAAADDFELEGKWKLVFLVQGLELLIVDVAAENDAFKATVVDAFQQLGKVEIKSFTSKPGEVTLVFQYGSEEIRFKGAPVTKGDDVGAVLGVLGLRGSPFPARLEKTESDKVQPPMPNQKLNDASQTQDAKERVKKLQEVIHEAPGPISQQAYTILLQSAEAGGLTEDQVRKGVDAWFKGAKPYGAEWTTQCRISALQGLQGKKPYAKLALALAQQAKKALAKDAPREQQAAVAKALAGAAKLAGEDELAAKADVEYGKIALEMAQQAEKDLPKNASLDQQAAVAQALASAAKLAGDDKLAAKAEADLAALNARADEEYHAKVPPFKPKPFAGREDAENDRVVLFELFTGAQCPPCVAADVAFDALLATYQPTELVTMQYHLHIPGPDPLTNPDSESRSGYYSLRGTPSTYFNGVAAAGGGGGMPQSKGKYDEFRQEIDKQLASAKSAKIELQLTRSGDTILVSATAQAGADDEAKDDGESKLRLRVALTEEAIRYVGGNQLRFHHHVVRGFPGGVEGKALAAGEGKVELTIDLDEVREGLNTYLDDFAKGGRGFPAAMPKIDFKGLAVVAFVQDDADKRVLHAVQASVPEAQ